MSISLIVFLIIFFGGLWWSIIKHPIGGLFAYTTTLYGNPAFHWWGKDLPNIRWSLVAAFFTLIGIYFNKKKRKELWLKSGAAQILIAYTLWMWIQLSWALSYDLHLDACVLFTKYLVLFYMIYTIVEDDWSLFLFINFNIFGAFYWAKGIREITHTGRVEGFGGPGIDDANTLGMHLVVVLFFVSLMFLKKNTLKILPTYWKILKIFYIIAALFIANGIVQTISRSAFLGLIAGGIVIVFSHYKSIRKKLIAYSILSLIGFSFLVPSTFWERMDTIRSAVEGEYIESSAYSRIVIAKAQLKMFSENIFGSGHRGTAELSPYYMPQRYLTGKPGQQPQRSSHCTFLTTLVEQGIPGAIMFLMMVFWVIKTTLLFPKENESIYLYMMMIAASLAAIFISGFFVDYLKVEIQIYCFAMLSSLKELGNRVEKNWSITTKPTNHIK